MSTIDLPYLRKWIGKTKTDGDILSSRHARLMAATLGRSPADLVNGKRLPPLWHWIYFLGGEPPTMLGPDGHPARGGFLPPVPLPNRMWAGGQLDFHGDLLLDSGVERRSTITAVDHKQGRSGDLVFVTVFHEFFHQGNCAVTEYHDIVYKEAQRASVPALPPAMPEPAESFCLTPDNTMLFRYSALTFNGHRIHYDADYCREVEGYSNLVIHGPLNATQLAGFAEKVGRRPLKHFRYRGLQPAILGCELTYHAAPADDQLMVWVTLPDGHVCMHAEASF